MKGSESIDRLCDQLRLLVCTLGVSRAAKTWYHSAPPEARPKPGYLHRTWLRCTLFASAERDIERSPPTLTFKKLRVSPYVAMSEKKDPYEWRRQLEVLQPFGKQCFSLKAWDLERALFEGPHL